MQETKRAWQLYARLLPFSTSVIYVATCGLAFSSWILRTFFFLENYTGTGGWQCPYIQGKCSYVRCTKRRKKKKRLALWGISWYHIMYNVMDEISHKPRLLQTSSTVFHLSFFRPKSKFYHRLLLNQRFRQWPLLLYLCFIIIVYNSSWWIFKQKHVAFFDKYLKSCVWLLKT